MTVYVDPLMDYGWRLGPSCHMFSDSSINELHRLASRMGLKRSWFQDKSLPHYDLTKGMRFQALRHGAKEIGFNKEWQKIINKWRKARS